MYKTHKGEIATFISIATLIGIAVFTFITSAINTNISQKQTTSTKAAYNCGPSVGQVSRNCTQESYTFNGTQCCATSIETINVDYNSDWEGYICPDGYENQYDGRCTKPFTDCNYNYNVSCSSGTFDWERSECCENVEDVVDPYEPEYQSPNNSAYSTCYSGTCIEGSCDGSEMDDVYGESCGVEGYSCCKNRETAYIPGPEGSQDPESYLGQTEQPVQSDFACESTDLSCDTSGNGCDGSVEGYCHQSGWGVCCRPYSTETPQAQQSSTRCEDMGGECLYDGWGSSIDSNLYEKVDSGECNWVYTCYKQKTQQTEGSSSLISEEITSSPEISADPSPEISPEPTGELRRGVVKINGVETMHYSDNNIVLDITYVPDTYTEENPGELTIEENGEETYISRNDDIDYRVSFATVQENLDTGVESEDFEVTE